MPLHECFHVPVTSCQRAEVKRVLHCDATTSVDMDALLSETLPAVAIFSPQQLQISLHKFHRIYRLSIFHYLKIEIRSFHAILIFSYTILYSSHIKISDRSNSHFLRLMSSMESISYFKTISVRDFHFDDNNILFLGGLAYGTSRCKC